MNQTPQLPFDICSRKHGGNPESAAANRKIQPTKEAVRMKVLGYITSCGWHGATADEIAAAWECSANHVAPRLVELRALGLIFKTDRRRKTRAGCNAAVMIAAKKFEAA